MNLKSLISALGLTVLLSANALAAQEVGNKICPVSNQPVGEMGDIVKVEHNGKTYNLCCSMCKKDFEKNPESFTKKAEDEVSGAAAPGAHDGHDHK